MKPNNVDENCRKLHGAPEIYAENHQAVNESI